MYRSVWPLSLMPASTDRSPSLGMQTGHIRYAFALHDEAPSHSLPIHWGRHAKFQETIYKKSDQILILINAGCITFSQSAPNMALSGLHDRMVSVRP